MDTSNCAKFLIWAALAAVIVIGGCSSSEVAKSGSYTEPAHSQAPSSDLDKPMAVTAAKQDPRKVQRSANLAMRATDPEKAEGQIQALLDEVGGYMLDSSLTKDGGRASLRATLKAPVDRFQETIGRVAALGYVTSKSMQAQDVTAELALLRRRAADSKAEQSRLETKAKQAGAGSGLEGQAAELAARAHEARAAMAATAASAEFSTIAVEVHQQMGLHPGEKDPNWFQNEAGSALASLGQSGRVILGGLIWLVVYSPVWGACALVLWWLVKNANRWSAYCPKTPSR